MYKSLLFLVLFTYCANESIKPQDDKTQNKRSDIAHKPIDDSDSMIKIAAITVAVVAAAGITYKILSRKSKEQRLKSTKKRKYDDISDLPELNTESFTIDNKDPVKKQYKEKASVQINKGDSVISKIRQLSDEHNVKIVFADDVKDSVDIQYDISDVTIFDMMSQLCLLMNWKMHYRCDSIYICKDAPYMYTHQLNVLNTSGHSVAKTIVNTESDVGRNQTEIKLHSEMSNHTWKEIEQFLVFLLTQKNSPDTDDMSYLAAETDYPDMSGDKKDNMNTLKKDFYVDRQSGLITVRATQAQHIKIIKYLHELEQTLNTQVRFEGKIFAVHLTQEHKMGVDLSKLFTFPMKEVSPFVSIAVPQSSDGQLMYDNSSDDTTNKSKEKKHSVRELRLTDIVDFLGEHGTLETVSSPELNISHNHTGIFRYTTNLVYFNTTTDISFDKQDKNRKSGKTTITRKPEVIPVGFTLHVQASISKKGNIIANIKQILSDKESVVKDKDDKEYPIVSSKEMDTRLNLKPGQWIVLGGYIVESSDNNVKYTVFQDNKASRKKETKEILCIMRAYPMRNEITSKEERLRDMYLGDQYG